MLFVSLVKKRLFRIYEGNEIGAFICNCLKKPIAMHHVYKSLENSDFFLTNHSMPILQTMINS